MKWQTSSLGEVTTRIRNGLNISQTADAGGLPITRIETISNQVIDPNRVGFAGIHDGEKTDWYLSPGEIVFSHINSEERIGNCALYEGIPHPLVHGMNLLALTPNERKILPKFLLYYFRSPQFRLSLRPMIKRAVNQASVSIGNLKGLEILLPPPSEQQLIVKILDQADNLRKNRAEADAKATRIFPALFYKMFGDPTHWETDGCTEPLGNLVETQGGGTPSKQNPTYWGGDIPWVSPKDMKRDFIHDSEDHITQLALNETNSRLVTVNSILIVVRGMILARYVPLAVSVEPVAINQDLKALRVTDERVSPLFLFAALKALGQRLHSSIATAAHGTRKLDTDRLLSMPILIPEKQKHDDFVAWFKQLREFNEKRMTTGPCFERLFGTLLHRAFTGELTAKWREEHMKELLAELEVQAKSLEISPASA